MAGHIKPGSIPKVVVDWYDTETLAKVRSLGEMGAGRHQIIMVLGCTESQAKVIRSDVVLPEDSPLDMARKTYAEARSEVILRLGATQLALALGKATRWEDVITKDGSIVRLEKSIPPCQKTLDSLLRRAAGTGAPKIGADLALWARDMVNLHADGEVSSDDASAAMRMAAARLTKDDDGGAEPLTIIIDGA